MESEFEKCNFEKLYQDIYDGKVKAEEAKKRIIESKIDINGISKSGQSLMTMCALRKRHNDILGMLLDMGANPNLVELETPLQNAIFEINLVGIKKLLKHGADLGFLEEYRRSFFVEKSDVEIAMKIFCHFRRKVWSDFFTVL